jgi:hypothetical protein
MRRICLIALAAVLSVAACGPSTTTPTPSLGVGGGGGETEGGGPTLAPGATATPGASGSQGMSTGGQVTITSGSATVTLTDATCHHAVVGGVGITTVMAGNQEAGDGKPDGISMNIPDDPSLNATISGSLGGRAFALRASDARGHVEGNSGTWSGTDGLGSNARFSGTFTCPSM